MRKEISNRAWELIFGGLAIVWLVAVVLHKVICSKRRKGLTLSKAGEVRHLALILLFFGSIDPSAGTPMPILPKKKIFFCIISSYSLSEESAQQDFFF